MDMPMRKFILLLVIVGGGIASLEADENDSNLRFGWIEKVIIEPWGVTTKAKLDTGAKTSSMHAENIKEFEKSGEDWVRFVIALKNEESDKVVAETFERPVHRRIRVFGAGGDERRPVVLMKLCVGKTVYEEQFSLKNRDDMNYPILLGRRTIRHLGVVDVTKTFELTPDCSAKAT